MYENKIINIKVIKIITEYSKTEVYTFNIINI